MRHLTLALGQRGDLRIWRQNVGHIPVRDAAGRVTRLFHAARRNRLEFLLEIIPSKTGADKHLLLRKNKRAK